MLLAGYGLGVVAGLTIFFVNLVVGFLMLLVSGMLTLGAMHEIPRNRRTWQEVGFYAVGAVLSLLPILLNKERYLEGSGHSSGLVIVWINVFYGYRDYCQLTGRTLWWNKRAASLRD